MNNGLVRERNEIHYKRMQIVYTNSKNINIEFIKINECYCII